MKSFGRILRVSFSREVGFLALEIAVSTIVVFRF